MINTVENINNEIKRFFGDNLVSIATFGSSVRRKQFRIRSDVDYLIILRRLASPQDVLSRELKRKLKTPFPLVAFNIYSEEDFPTILMYNAWLVLTIKLGYEIYVDHEHFFQNSIENEYRKLKQKKVGKLAWYIENQKLQRSLLDHYTQLSGEYLKAARVLYDNHFFSFANELLIHSVHCFMIRKLLTKNFFITTGEIVQLFFNVYSDDAIFIFRDSFFKLEQKVGQKHSFDFDKEGGMLFITNQSNENGTIFEKAILDFEKLQIFFNERNW